VNVLEEILVKETYNQIDDLRPELQSKAKVKVAEVLAYALNRLPPLFVTSPSGWHHQSNYATSDLQPQISQLVKQGLKNALLGDPIHDLTPLPNHLFSNSAGVLHQLSKIFGRSHIRWRDVPALVESIISRSVINKISDETIIQSDDATVIQGGADHLSRYTLGLVYGSKRFREKLATQQREQESNLQESHQTWTWEMKERDMAEMEYRALQAYTLQARLGMI
ncbi:MAG: late competence development ComFB family protein, partial [Dolichospermum sp.]